MVLPHVFEEARNVDSGEQESKPTGSTKPNKNAVIHIVLYEVRLKLRKEAQVLRIRSSSVCLTGMVCRVRDLRRSRVKNRVFLVVPPVIRSESSVRPLVDNVTPQKPGV